MGSVRKGMDIDSALRKKGFIRERDGKHIRYFFPSVPRIRTMMSHGMMGKTLSATLIGEMARQRHLTKAQFLAFIDCTLDEKGYREILEKQGFAV